MTRRRYNCVVYIMSVIKKLFTSFLLCFLCVANIYAETLRDPRFRDEDISMAIISSSYKQLPDGMYEYLFNIESPELNKGTIAHFSLDVSCNTTFSPTVFSEPPIGNFFTNDSSDGLHLPLQAYGVMYYTYGMGITGDNRLVWGVGIEPGKKAIGYRVLSPVRPGKIRYILEPRMDVDGWDYHTYSVETDEVPDLPDFVTTGIVDGPVCPGNSDMFSGSNYKRSEPSRINNLLRYSEPSKDRFHVKNGTKEVKFTIHYSEEMDPKTFNVEPGYIKHFFNPVPGISQTVMLPLKMNGKDSKKAKFKFEARMIGVATGKDKTKADRMKDKDEFEIRIDD